jgi:hypothetical protein
LVLDQDATEDAANAEAEVGTFDIPFEVPYNDRFKEISLPSTTDWDDARIAFGRKMVRDPTALTLGYINPFKPRGNTKAIPTSLESEEEWDALVQHVRTFLQQEKAKNKGRGGSKKVWRITLVVVNESSLKDDKVSISHLHLNFKF